MSDTTTEKPIENPTNSDRSEDSVVRLVIPVSGAGDIRFGTDSVMLCGQSVGLSVGVSWGSHGYAGGVIDATEVERLRDELSAWLESQRKSIIHARDYKEKRRQSLGDNANCPVSGEAD